MYYTEPRNLRSQRNPNNAYLILLVVCFCGWMMASVIPQLAFTVVPVVPAPLIPEGPTPQIIRERSIPQETVPTADSFKDQKKKPPALIAPALDWSDLSLLSDQGNAAVAKGTAIGTLFTAASWALTTRKDLAPALELRARSPQQSAARASKEFFAGTGIKKYAKGDAEATVSRPELIKEIQQFLCLKTTGVYGVFFDVSGCGKSTAIRQAIRELNTSGVVYVEMADNPKSFVTQLQDVFEFYPSPTNLQDNEGSNLDGWTVFSPILEQAAVTYNALAAEDQSHKALPMAVLVLDGADEIAQQDPAFLRVLQMFAKGCADRRSLRMVFVGSEGQTLPFLQSNSGFSRAVQFSSDYLDITDSQAIAYLSKNNKLTPSQVQDCVTNLTGGRFSLLNKVQAQAEIGKYEAVRRDMLGEFGRKLERCKVTVDNPLLLKLQAASSSLHKTSAEVQEDEALKLMDHAVLACLLRENVLTLKFGGLVTIHSRHIATSLRQCVPP